MIMPFGYGPQINAPLHALRRTVVEKMVEGKGLTPGTGKFREVVDRHLSKVKYHRTCKFDAEIPAAQLERARQGKWPAEKRVSKQRKKA